MRKRRPFTGAALWRGRLRVESDRELLADIADWGDGNAYTIEDPSSVQSILIDETMNQLPDSAREEEIRVELRGQSEALVGIDIAGAPQLYGRIAAVAKDSAEVILGAGERNWTGSSPRWSATRQTGGPRRVGVRPPKPERGARSGTQRGRG